MDAHRAMTYTETLAAAGGDVLSYLESVALGRDQTPDVGVGLLGKRRRRRRKDPVSAVEKWVVVQLSSGPKLRSELVPACDTGTPVEAEALRRLMARKVVRRVYRCDVAQRHWFVRHPQAVSIYVLAPDTLSTS